MSHFGNIGHHLIVAIIDHIPNGWVMFNGDMTNDPCLKCGSTFPQPGNHASFLDVILAVVAMPNTVLRRCGEPENGRAGWDIPSGYD